MSDLIICSVVYWHKAKISINLGLNSFEIWMQNSSLPVSVFEPVSTSSQIVFQKVANLYKKKGRKSLKYILILSSKERLPAHSCGILQEVSSIEFSGIWFINLMLSSYLGLQPRLAMLAEHGCWLLCGADMSCSTRYLESTRSGKATIGLPSKCVCLLLPYLPPFLF